MSAEDEVAADLKSVTAMGKKMKLEGDDLARYIKGSMKRMGHKAVTSWAPGEKPKSKGSGGFFGFGDDDDDDDDL